MHRAGALVILAAAVAIPAVGQAQASGAGGGARPVPPETCSSGAHLRQMHRRVRGLASRGHRRRGRARGRHLGRGPRRWCWRPAPRASPGTSGQVTTVRAAWVQADANDSYTLWGSLDGRAVHRSRPGRDRRRSARPARPQGVPGRSAGPLSCASARGWAIASIRCPSCRCSARSRRRSRPTLRVEDAPAAPVAREHLHLLEQRDLRPLGVRPGAAGPGPAAVGLPAAPGGAAAGLSEAARPVAGRGRCSSPP